MPRAFASDQVVVDSSLALMPGLPFGFPSWFVDRYFPRYHENIEGNPDRAALKNLCDWVVASPDHQHAINTPLNYRLECQQDFVEERNRITGIFGPQGSGKTQVGLLFSLTRESEKHRPLLWPDGAKQSFYEWLDVKPEEARFSAEANVYNSIADCMDDLPNFHPGKSALIDDPLGHKNAPAFAFDMARLQDAWDKLRQKRYDFYVTGISGNLFPLESVFEMNEVRYRSRIEGLAHVINRRRVSSTSAEFNVYGFYSVTLPNDLITPQLTGSPAPKDFLDYIQARKDDLMNRAAGAAADLRTLRELRELILRPEFPEWSRTIVTRESSFLLSPRLAEAPSAMKKGIEGVWRSVLTSLGCVQLEGKGAGKVSSEMVRKKQGEILKWVDGQLEAAKSGAGRTKSMRREI